MILESRLYKSARDIKAIIKLSCSRASLIVVVVVVVCGAIVRLKFHTRALRRIVTVAFARKTMVLGPRGCNFFFFTILLWRIYISALYSERDALWLSCVCVCCQGPGSRRSRSRLTLQPRHPHERFSLWVYVCIVPINVPVLWSSTLLSQALHIFSTSSNAYFSSFCCVCVFILLVWHSRERSTELVV